MFYVLERDGVRSVLCCDIEFTQSDIKNLRQLQWGTEAVMKDGTHYVRHKDDYEVYNKRYHVAIDKTTVDTLAHMLAESKFIYIVEGNTATYNNQDTITLPE